MGTCVLLVVNQQWEPNMQEVPDVLLRVTRQPAQSESLLPAIFLGHFCRLKIHTKRGCINKYRSIRFSIIMCLLSGVAMPRADSLEAY